MRKLEKAKNCDGPSFIHVLAPCPTGWQTPTDISIELAKEAVDNGLWYLAEYENKEFTLNRNPKEFTDISDYLSKQGRFSHLDENDIALITEGRDETWEKIRRDWVK